MLLESEYNFFLTQFAKDTPKSSCPQYAVIIFMVTFLRI